jgi:hypothetical protein
MPLPPLPPARKPYVKGRAVAYLEGTIEEEDEEDEEAVEVVGKSSKGKQKEGQAATTKKRPENGSKKLAESQGSTGGKPGRAHKSTSVVPSDTDDEKILELNDPPCKRCAKVKIPCVVQAEPDKSSVKDKRSVRIRLACVPCRDHKNKCELTSPDVVSAPPVRDEDTKDKTIPAPTKPKRTRKKSAVVPAEAGEYTH